MHIEQEAVVAAAVHTDVDEVGVEGELRTVSEAVEARPVTVACRQCPSAIPPSILNSRRGHLILAILIPHFSRIPGTTSRLNRGSRISKISYPAVLNRHSKVESKTKCKI